jgi:hypothetical protein
VFLFACLFVLQYFVRISLSLWLNLSILSIFDEGYSRNASCALILMSTLLLVAPCSRGGAIWWCSIPFLLFYTKIITRLCWHVISIMATVPTLGTAGIYPTYRRKRQISQRSSFHYLLVNIFFLSFSFLFLLNSVFFSAKRQLIPILQSLIWPDSECANNYTTDSLYIVT